MPVVVVTDVYPASEEPIPGISGKLVVDAITEARPAKRVVYLPHRSKGGDFLVREVGPGDSVKVGAHGADALVADLPFTG